MYSEVQKLKGHIFVKSEDSWKYKPGCEGTYDEETKRCDECGASLLFARRFLLLKRLDTGEFCTVFLANDQEIEKKVVIKVLNPQWIEPNPFETIEEKGKRVRKRFEREAYIGKKILGSHHLVGTLEYDKDEKTGYRYLVQNYAQKETLQQFMFVDSACKRVDIRVVRELDFGQRLQICLNLARAVEEMHDLQILHRDFNPKNIMINPDENYQIQVIDFGASKYLGDQDQTDSLFKPFKLNRDDITISGTHPEVGQVEMFDLFFGSTCGPEVFEIHPVIYETTIQDLVEDPAQKLGYEYDIFSLGVCLYSLLMEVHPHNLSPVAGKYDYQEFYRAKCNPNFPDKFFNPRHFDELVHIFQEADDDFEIMEDLREECRTLFAELEMILRQCLDRNPENRKAVAPGWKLREKLEEISRGYEDLCLANKMLEVGIGLSNPLRIFAGVQRFIFDKEDYRNSGRLYNEILEIATREAKKTSESTDEAWTTSLVGVYNENYRIDMKLNQIKAGVEKQEGTFRKVYETLSAFQNSLHNIKDDSTNQISRLMEEVETIKNNFERFSSESTTDIKGETPAREIKKEMTQLRRQLESFEEREKNLSQKVAIAASIVGFLFLLTLGANYWTIQGVADRPGGTLAKKEGEENKAGDFEDLSQKVSAQKDSLEKISHLLTAREMKVVSKKDLKAIQEAAEFVQSQRFHQFLQKMDQLSGYAGEVEALKAIRSDIKRALSQESSSPPNFSDTAKKLRDLVENSQKILANLSQSRGGENPQFLKEIQKSLENLSFVAMGREKSSPHAISTGGFGPLEFSIIKKGKEKFLFLNRDRCYYALLTVNDYNNDIFEDAVIIPGDSQALRQWKIGSGKVSLHQLPRGIQNHNLLLIASEKAKKISDFKALWKSVKKTNPLLTREDKEIFQKAFSQGEGGGLRLFFVRQGKIIK